VGRIIDVFFHNDLFISFAVGGKGLKAFLRKLGSPTNAYLVLPHRFIEKVKGYSIIIHGVKENLSKLYKGVQLDDKTISNIQAFKQSSEDMKMELYKAVTMQAPQSR
jgi:hypothetical protein